MYAKKSSAYSFKFTKQSPQFRRSCETAGPVSEGFFRCDSLHYFCNILSVSISHLNNFMHNIEPIA